MWVYTHIKIQLGDFGESINAMDSIIGTCTSKTMVPQKPHGHFNNNIWENNISNDEKNFFSNVHTFWQLEKNIK